MAEKYIKATECEKYFYEHLDDNGMIGAMNAIDEMPAADVQFIRHGRWIDIHEYCKMNGYIPSGVAVYYWCSECMNEQEKISDFCPCCGADMREPKAIKG